MKTRLKASVPLKVPKKSTDMVQLPPDLQSVEKSIKGKEQVSENEKFNNECSSFINSYINGTLTC
jgi:hypothetical protein